MSKLQVKRKKKGILKLISVPKEEDITIKTILHNYVIPDEWKKRVNVPGAGMMHSWNKINQGKKNEIIKNIIKLFERKRFDFGKLKNYLKKKHARTIKGNVKSVMIETWIEDELSFISNSLKGHFGKSLGDELIKILSFKLGNKDIKEFIKEVRNATNRMEKKIPITWFIIRNWKD